jgi:hypothetical protein
VGKRGRGTVEADRAAATEGEAAAGSQAVHFLPRRAGAWADLASLAVSGRERRDHLPRTAGLLNSADNNCAPLSPP